MGLILGITWKDKAMFLYMIAYKDDLARYKVEEKKTTGNSIRHPYLLVKKRNDYFLVF